MDKLSDDFWGINIKEKLRNYLPIIENNSLPFIEYSIVIPGMSHRHLLFVSGKDDEKQKQFASFSGTYFKQNPQICFGGNSYKLTYVQVTGCKRDELKKMYRKRS